MHPILLWLRQDLRLTDNPALVAACETGRPVIPCYILDDRTPGEWRMGGAQRWWLHHSLEKLAEQFQAGGIKLVLRRGDPAKLLPALVEETGADAVYWNRCYEPFAIARDTQLKAMLPNVKSFNASLLWEPWEIASKQGGYYKVFTPFWKQCLSQAAQLPEPLDAPQHITPFSGKVTSDRLEAWQLLPKPDWAAGFRTVWTPGEKGAQRQAIAFFSERLAQYAARRDFPAEEVSSRLSPHLHFGEISPRQLWNAALTWREMSGVPGAGDKAAKFLQEIGWREFSYHLLYHFPALPEIPFRSEFAAFPWQENPKLLNAWQQGKTGYPLVDAGMRQLWHTGIMHNRVRMVVGSFLVKHLLIAWQQGEAWFWDTLLDADLAANAFNWQWVAGSGADAAPYFRIFNPVTQSQKFDSEGEYIRRWVPELAGLPTKYIHTPWETPPDVLYSAGVALGADYPLPIVDHNAARNRALQAYRLLSREET